MEYNNDCAIRLSKLERRQKGSRGATVHLLGGMLQFARCMISMEARWVGALHLQTAGFILRVLMFICAFSGSARFAADIRLILAWLFPTRTRRCSRKTQVNPAINCSHSI